MMKHNDYETIEIINREYHIAAINQKVFITNKFEEQYIGTVSHIYENSGAGEQIYVLTNQTADHTLNVDNPATNAVPYTASESESSPLKCQILQVMLYCKYIRRLVSL
ncbi:hypothetical protein ACVR05_08035 [Streptococcus caprae]|uniref:Uncharacterized protein n=1 Tax=Streptococcus caprae TaxID=1640501 RepID=A0ABV8CSZ1_9STRE